MFNKSRVCLHAWYYPHMSIHIQNRHFCMYLSIDSYDQITHTQHILNMFQCVLRVNSCLFHVYNVVFISKMSDIITPYRKTRNFRLLTTDHMYDFSFHYISVYVSIHNLKCFYVCFVLFLVYSTIFIVILCISKAWQYYFVTHTTHTQTNSTT